MLSAVFLGHHPVVFTLTFPRRWSNQANLAYPQKDWTELQLTPSILEYVYETADPLELTNDVEQNLALWSNKVETAIDHTLHIQHGIDPLRCPMSALPADYRRRCQTIIPSVMLGFVRMAQKQDRMILNPKVRFKAMKLQIK